MNNFKGSTPDYSELKKEKRKWEEDRIKHRENS